MTGLSDVNPPVGIQPNDIEAEFYARGGNVCAGYCYPICLEQSALITADSVTVSVLPGGEGSVFANIAGGEGAGVSSATDVYAGIFVIAMQDIADTQKGKCKVVGIVDAIVVDSGDTSILVGKPLHVVAKTSVSAASMLNALAATSNASPRKYVGQALAAVTSSGSVHPSTPALMKVNFDGWHGFGAGQV